MSRTTDDTESTVSDTTTTEETHSQTESSHGSHDDFSLSLSSDDDDHETSDSDEDLSGLVDDNSCILRGKWIYDGSETIDDMIAALQREIHLLTELKADGWQVDGVVEDDYAHLCKDVPTSEDETSEAPVSEDNNDAAAQEQLST